MTPSPSPSPNILCPVDFSESSRGALRYAAAIADHFDGTVTVATVTDPLLADAADMSGGTGHMADVTARGLRAFVQDTFGGNAPPVPALRFELTAGKAPQELLGIAALCGADLMVLASHGATGVRRMFIGSTTERVLRETTVPVVVTPGGDAGPASADALRTAVRHVLVPVDLTDATTHQVNVAAAIAKVLGASLLLVHVVEPVRTAVPGLRLRPNVNEERRHRAEGALDVLVGTLPPSVRPEALVAFGEPAEEIAKIALDRGAGLVVIGLQASPLLGPHMGSVTFRVLCLARGLVVALPPPVPRQQAVESVLQEKSVWSSPLPPASTSGV